MTSTSSEVQGDSDYKKQWKITCDEIEVIGKSIKNLDDTHDTIELKKLKKQNLTPEEIFADQKYAKLTTELERLKVEKNKLLDLLKSSTEVYLLLFICNAFRGKPV